ncbi:MAG: tRNA pseudouridine(38-40) synthase TruA [candidate division Zixibacteria bacterium 4484_95]|nr:MAG: tRNA pseudouridine(38-40) synthase TruA [candidate division Zixibacteria bacterium 4484_95]RKX20535.1 MAG: tRNA pseudouridine(38-40) synthase TruA [candidate division Zixibacteria bacterium]
MSGFYYKMIVEYDGTNFSGWQIQPRKRTVQAVLKDAIEKYTRQRVRLTGAGRTDAGVHATGQVCSFGLLKKMPVDELYYRINRILPDDIGVKEIVNVSDGFDPRRDAIWRKYRYYISEYPQPLVRYYQYQYRRRLNIDILNKAARLFLGCHDFTAFCKRKSLKERSYCKVYVSRWFRYGGALIYEIIADRFLHHMVRRIVGVMLAVENAKLNLTHIKMFLDNKDNVRFSIPACGLVLTEVRYRKDKK